MVGSVRGVGAPVEGKPKLVELGDVDNDSRGITWFWEASEDSRASLIEEGTPNLTRGSSALPTTPLGGPLEGGILGFLEAPSNTEYCIGLGACRVLWQ